MTSAKEKSSKIKILDCTLRDGGYHNNWDFEPKLVRKYFEAMEASKIDAIELGFRFVGNSGFRGPFAYTTDSFIEHISPPVGPIYAVMLNAGDFDGFSNVTEILDGLFGSPRQSLRVSMVRVASRFEELELSREILTNLHARGFKTALNLMQIADKNQLQLKKLAEIANLSKVDVLYLADSTGTLTPTKTKELFETVSSFGVKAELGFHGHDNLGMALVNSLAAIESGATWVDGTVAGMGRGPGNTRTEELKSYLNQENNDFKSLVKLFSLVHEEFKDLEKDTPWGRNPFFFYAGLRGIHPTYVQELIEDPRYMSEDIIGILKNLDANSSKQYNRDNLDVESKYLISPGEPDWNPSSAINSDEILIIGSGPSLEKRLDAIELFITQQQPAVLSLNANMAINKDLVDYFVACHPLRILSDHKDFVKLGRPVVMPVSRFPKEFQEELTDIDVKDFGITTGTSNFIFGETGAEVRKLLALSYALAIAGSAGAKKIWICGLDGYEKSDIRNAEINDAIQSFRTSTDIELISLTPTIYDIKQKSIYGLLK